MYAKISGPKALGIPTTTTVVLRDPLNARVVMDASGRKLQQQP